MQARLRKQCASACFVIGQENKFIIFHRARTVRHVPRSICMQLSSWINIFKKSAILCVEFPQVQYIDLSEIVHIAKAVVIVTSVRIALWIGFFLLWYDCPGLKNIPVISLLNSHSPPLPPCREKNGKGMNQLYTGFDIREIKNLIRGKGQTSDSVWQFLR